MFLLFTAATKQLNMWPTRVLLYFGIVSITYEQLLMKDCAIHVDEQIGKDNKNCILYGNSSCLTLDYAVQNTGNKTLFILMSAITTVNTVIKFKHRNEIAIMGNGIHDTLIQCNCSESDVGHCGIVFINSANITLRGFTIYSCSVSTDIFGDHSASILSGLHFSSCENITMNEISVAKSNGFGVSIINSHGEIEINESSFLNNSFVVSVDKYGGGGMLILLIRDNTTNEFSSVENDMKGNYSIMRSCFNNNMLTMPTNAPQWYHLAYGGGLNVLLSHNATTTYVFISGCNFTNNTSLGGGGMAANLRQGVLNNTVLIEKSSFCNNNGSFDRRGGGGGLMITVSSSSTDNFSMGNVFNITDCLFLNNTARYGGGVSVMVGKSATIIRSKSNHINFSHCQWKSNKASVSGAVDLSPDIQSQDSYIFNALIYFNSCHVIDNYLVPYNETIGKGVFLVTKLHVKFVGDMLFETNRHTALFIHSSFIHVIESSTMNFSKNDGSVGGAIRMFGFSGIHYDNNTTFIFEKNTANFLGGAIYSENADQHLPFSSHTCLFKPSMNNANNVHFSFIGNKAGTHYGESIYVTSINACKRKCIEVTNNMSIDPFNSECLGNFTFNDTADEHDRYVERIITTDISRVYVNNSVDNMKYVIRGSKSVPVLQIVPGQPTYIALRTLDDYNHKTTDIAAFYANLESPHDDVYIDTGSRIINNNHVIVHGVPGRNGTLLLSSITSRGIFIMVEFEMLHCPPGFILKEKSCICVFKKKYIGISGCNAISGLLLPGYWAGYILKGNETASEKTLYNSDCPPSYCKPFRNKTTSVFGGRFLQLPATASKTDLEDLVCAENRYGILCGQCKYQTSVFYHSNTFQCKKDKHCEYGLLLYILVDLIPIGILFGVLLTLDVSLTSGTAYSIIFMIQQIHALEVTTRGAIVFEKNFLIETVSVIYSLFNLEFLSIESLSFCLWSNANTMDVLMMKYVSIIYSMALVVIFVLLLNKCNCNFVKRVCKRNKSGRHYSVAQGLTAFLVVCYTQVTRITLNILSKGVIYAIGLKQYNNVAFLDGESNYFHGRHLYYSIPALLFLVFIIIPPPLILFFDPVFLKMEDMLWHRIRRQPWTSIRIKIKPILDSFQNCFKDNTRWFAGLFFFYRFLILGMSMVTNNTLGYYYIVEALLVIFLTLHSMIHPFANMKHNIIASLCLCNLVLVNYLTICIYSIVTTQGYDTDVRIHQWLQVCLIYLPIVVGIIWVARYSIYLLLRRVFKQRQIFWTRLDSSEDDNDIDIIFNRTITDYKSFEEVNSLDR